MARFLSIQAGMPVIYCLPMETQHHERHPARHVLGATGAVALTVLSVALLAGAAFYARTYLVSPQMAAVISSVLVDLTNDDRADASLPTLTVNPKLVAAAQAKANDMAAKGYFAHTSPDGTTSWQWFRDAGYAYASAGENLAVDFSDSEDVEEAWMDSPTHRANIMSGKFTEIGIATAVGELDGERTIFVVQMFGRPAAAAAAPIQTATVPSDATEIAVAETDVLGSTDETPAAVPAAAVEGEAAQADSALPSAAASAEEPEPILSIERTQEAPVWGLLAASPERALRTMYLVFALVLFGALLMITRMEFRKHHYRHMIAASALFVMLGGLFFIADTLVFTAPTIGQAATESNG